MKLRLICTLPHDSSKYMRGLGFRFERSLLIYIDKFDVGCMLVVYVFAGAPPHARPPRACPRRGTLLKP